MSTARLTFGSILGAVNTAATAITSTIAIVGTGAETLHGFVQSASQKHNVRQALDDTSWLNDYVEVRAKELIESQEATDKWLALNPQRQQRFDTIRSQLMDKANVILGTTPENKP